MIVGSCHASIFLFIERFCDTIVYLKLKTALIFINFILQNLKYYGLIQFCDLLDY
jgi:hypothetical protein